MNLPSLRTWLVLGLIVGLVMAGKKIVSNWKASLNAQKYLPAFNAVEDANRIPHDLLARMAYQESRFRDDVINGTMASAAGALGIMQLVPKWHPGVNPLDPYASISYAGRYLRQLYNQFGSWTLALAAYNWGPGNVSAHQNDSSQWPAETVQYVKQITGDVPVA